LTTIFTPPDSCSTRLFTTDISFSGGFISWDAQPVDDASLMSGRCYPTEWVKAHGYFGDVAFSPGVCPQDYTTFSTAVVSEVTVAYCCPS
jgi:hypothetical protein